LRYVTPDRSMGAPSAGSADELLTVERMLASYMLQMHCRCGVNRDWQTIGMSLHKATEQLGLQ
jgi:hypothetical protein